MNREDSDFCSSWYTLFENLAFSVFAKLVILLEKLQIVGMDT